MTGRDLTRLEQRLFPAQDGEAAVRHRSGTVDTVNPDGTVDLILGAVTVPSASVLSGAVVAPGDVVQVLTWRGDLLVLGQWATAPPPDGIHHPFLPVIEATTPPGLGVGGLAEGRWLARDGVVDIEAYFLLGTGATAGSGDYLVRLPFVGAMPIGSPVGSVSLIGDDPDDPDERRQWQLVVASHAEPLFAIRGTGDSTSRAAGDAVPWPWGDGHLIAAQARYRTGDTIPDSVPFLEGLTTGVDSSATTSRSIPLPLGDGDKFVAVTRAGLPADNAITVPTGWTHVAGTLTGSGGILSVVVFVKAASTDTSVTVTSGSGRLGWVTGLVRLADLSVTAAATTGQVNTDSPNPPSVSGPVTTNYLALAFAARGGGSSSITAFPDDLPFNHVANFGTTGTNTVQAAMAAGPFFGVSTVNPGPFTHSVEGSARAQTLLIASEDHP